MEKKTHTPFSSIHNVDIAIVRDISAHPVSSEAERQRLADWSNSLLSRHYDVFTGVMPIILKDCRWRIRQTAVIYCYYLPMATRSAMSLMPAKKSWKFAKFIVNPNGSLLLVNGCFRHSGQRRRTSSLVQAPFIADAADVRGMKRPIIMGRIIDAAEWIKCMPIRNISLDIAISIIDRWIPENESTWYWQISPEGNSFERTEGPWDICLDIDTFLQWLSGYIPADELIRQHRILLRRDWQENDAMHTLEQIPVLHGLMINEIV